MLKKVLSTAIAVVALMAPPASADSGSITNVVDIGGGEVQATFSVQHDSCVPGLFGEPECGWRAEANYLDKHLPCPVNPRRSPHTSSIWDGSSHEGPSSETGTRTFFPLGKAKRLCLYSEQDTYSGNFTLLAQVVYTPPIPDLTLRDARLNARAALAEEFGSEYANARRTGRSCERLSRLSVRCWSRWGAGDTSYRGWVTVSNGRADDGSVVLNYRYRLKATNEYCRDRKRKGDRSFRGRRCTRVVRGEGRVGTMSD